MTNGRPAKAKAGAPGKPVSVNPATYFLAKRMESVGMLRPGQAFLLAAVQTAKKGKRK